VIFILVSKLFGSLAGFFFYRAWGESLWVGAAGLGILPIWLELLTTWATGVEPSLEPRKLWRYADAVVDILVFAVIPAFWVGVQFPSLGFDLCVFTFAGVYRVVHFLRKGLVGGLYFEGLPITYTGYLWLPLVLLLERGIALFALVLLYTASFLMVWTRLKIKRTQVPNDRTGIE
jgi:hypothetical protein